jgi:hypothetical protein
MPVGLVREHFTNHLGTNDLDDDDGRDGDGVVLVFPM